MTGLLDGEIDPRDLPYPHTHRLHPSPVLWIAAGVETAMARNVGNPACNTLPRRMR